MEYKILIALGSNYEQLQNVEKAKAGLQTFFPNIRFSRSLWTEPIGIESPRFVNAFAEAYTSLLQDEVVRQLKRLEQECGRTAEEKKQGIIRIDLDLMQYGTERLHPEDWDREYIVTLLQDL